MKFGTEKLSRKFLDSSIVTPHLPWSARVTGVTETSISRRAASYTWLARPDQAPSAWIQGHGDIYCVSS